MPLATQRLQLPYARQAIAAGRDNLIICLPGERDPQHGGKLLMWEAHQDTVPVEGMIIPPWTPEIRDGFSAMPCSLAMRTEIGANSVRNVAQHSGRPQTPLPPSFFVSSRGPI